MASAVKLEFKAQTPQALPTVMEIIWNPSLLQKIVKQMPAETLLHLRRTSTRWNSIFIPVLKKKHSHIKLTGRVGESVTGQNPEGNLMDYTELVKKSKEIPFSKYKLDDLHYADEHDMRDFFDICGGTVRTLWLDTTSIGHLTQIVYDLAPELTNVVMLLTGQSDGQLRQTPGTLPNLTRLGFDGAALQCFGTEDLRQLVYNATALRVLGLMLSMGTYIQVFGVLQELGAVDKLKGLLFNDLCPIAIQFLTVLANQSSNQLCLRLEWFFTSFGQNENAGEFQPQLYQFLLTQAATLWDLNIEVGISSTTQSPATTRFPKMESLRKFFITRNENNVFQFDGQTLGATFPGLTFFKYDDSQSNREGQKISMEEIGKLCHGTLTDLVWRSTVCLTKLRVWFPGVTRVEFALTEADLCELPFIWNIWPALQSLHLCYRVNMATRQLDLDELLTGMSKLDLETVERQFAEMGQVAITSQALRRFHRRYKTLFSIGDQKHLQKFTLETNDPEIVKFTNIGGYLGMAFAPQSLQVQIKARSGELELGRTIRGWLSAECLALIRGNLGPFAVIDL